MVYMSIYMVNVLIQTEKVVNPSVFLLNNPLIFKFLISNIKEHCSRGNF